jgi:hypothetical protein
MGSLGREIVNERIILKMLALIQRQKPAHDLVVSHPQDGVEHRSAGIEILADQDVADTRDPDCADLLQS